MSKKSSNYSAKFVPWNTARSYEHNGRPRSNVAEAAKRLGISPQSFWNRQTGRGWRQLNWKKIPSIPLQPPEGGKKESTFDNVDIETLRTWEPFKLTIDQILSWADAYFAKFKAWPTVSSGEISDCPGKTWTQIEYALRHGSLGLAAGSSLARLFEEKEKAGKWQSRRQPFDPLAKQKSIVAKVLEAFGKGDTLSQVANSAGIHVVTLGLWQRQSPELAAALKDAEAKAAGAETVTMTPTQFLPRVDGKWLGNGIFQRQKDKKILLSLEYLAGTDPYNTVHRSQWHHWIKNSCIDLDHAINGGKIRAFLASTLQNAIRKERIVFEQEDADLIIGRRSKSENRESPARPGKWLADDLWADKEWGTCGHAQKIAELIERSKKFVCYWSRRQHPALDANVNGGKPRSDKIGPLHQKPHAKKQTVYCLADYERIDAWQKQKEKSLETIGRAPPTGRKTNAEMVQHLKLETTDRIKLGSVLKVFRSVKPGDCDQRIKKYGAGRVCGVWHYDPEAFKRWLAGRSIRDVARALSNSPSEVSTKRLVKAVRFLQFVLTHGFFKLKVFNRFAFSPPIGKSLKPYGSVSHQDVKKWAKLAGVDISRLLPKAKKIIGVKHLRRGRPKTTSYWYLAFPLTILPDDATLSGDLNGFSANGKSEIQHGFDSPLETAGQAGKQLPKAASQGTNGIAVERPPMRRSKSGTDGPGRRREEEKHLEWYQQRVKENLSVGQIAKKAKVTKRAVQIAFQNLRKEGKIP